MSASPRARLALLLPRLARFVPLLRLDNLFDAGLLFTLALWGWGIANGGLGSPWLLGLWLAALFGIRCTAWLMVNTLTLLDYAHPDAGPWQRLRAVPRSGWAAFIYLLLPAGGMGFVTGGSLFWPLGVGGALALAYLPLRRRTPLSAFALAFALGSIPLSAFPAAGVPFGKEAGLAATVVVLWSALILMHFALVADARYRQLGMVGLAQAFHGSEKPIGGIIMGLLLLGLILLGVQMKAAAGWWLGTQLTAAVLAWQLWLPWVPHEARRVYRTHLAVGVVLVATALLR